MTRILTLLAVFTVFFALAPQAQAKSWLDWIFTPSMPDFEKPYLYDAKTRHPQSWSNDNWSPASWTASRGSDKGVMDDLYASGIITDQYEDDGMPVLEVGQPFMELSNQDRYRVAAYVDDVFGITGRSESGSFSIVHEPSGDPIGLYTRHGLQLQ